MTRLDKIDVNIIGELSEDARRPFGKIAKKLGVSTQTVAKRYSDMKKNGTIQFCTIMLDLTKIGYEGTAHLLLSSRPQSDITDVVKQLRKTQNIIITTRAMGEYEGYAVLAFKNAKNLYEKVTQIRQLPNILKVDISFEIPGVGYFPPNINPFANLEPKPEHANSARGSSALTGRTRGRRRCLGS